MPKADLYVVLKSIINIVFSSLIKFSCCWNNIHFGIHLGKKAVKKSDK